MKVLLAAQLVPLFQFIGNRCFDKHLPHRCERWHGDARFARKLFYIFQHLRLAIFVAHGFAVGLYPGGGVHALKAFGDLCDQLGIDPVNLTPDIGHGLHIMGEWLAHAASD